MSFSLILLKNNHKFSPAVKILFFLFLFTFFQTPLVFCQEQPKKEREHIEIGSPQTGSSEVQAVADDLEYFREENKVVGRGNVVVTHKDIRLLADYAEVFTDTKKTYADGHVSVIRNEMTLSGEKGFYDFENNHASFPKGRIISPPFYIIAEQIEQVSKHQVNMYQATLTTCPWPDPHYDIKSNRAIVYPGDKLVAWNVTFRVLGFPIFWWPYLVIPLDEETGPFDFGAGQSKNFGNYALFGKTFTIIPKADGRELKTKFHIDYYRKRGTAVGNETWYHLDNVGDGYLKLYRIKDSRRPDPFYFESDEVWRTKERTRISWKHRTDFDPTTNLIAQWNEFKDPNFYHQFFNPEFSKEPVAQSFFTFTRNVTNYGFLVDVQKQASHFDNVLERLPEVRFKWNSTEIKNTGLYYTTDESYANLHNITHSETTDPNDPELKKKKITEVVTHLSQVETYHELSYPKRIFKYYDLTPNANARWDFWNHNAAGDSFKTANVLGLSGEASTRFYRFFDIPKGSFLRIPSDRMRHIIKPVINYTGVRQVSTRSELVHPLGSSFSVSDIIKFGLENRIQSKSGAGTRIDIVSLNTYANYEFNNPNNDTRLTTGSIELILRPYSWFQYRIQADVDLKQHRRTANTMDFVIATKFIDLKLNHRYVFTSKESLDSDKYFRRETNVVTLDGTVHLNNRWSAGGYFRWEVKRHSWREYEWRISRDLHDWVVHLGQNIRHSNINWLNHEIFLELQLKAFPGIDFSSGQRSKFADAKIGESVSGSNIAPPPPSLLG